MNERKPMDEYINKAKAIEAIRHDPMGGLNYKQILTELPAADVVPVVRCRGCKSRDEDAFCTGRGFPYQLVPDDGFCDKGKRKE